MVVPRTIFSDRDVTQTAKRMAARTIGQGDWVSKRSEKSRKSPSGSNSFSSMPPYSRVKERNSISTKRLSWRNASEFIDGKSLGNGMKPPRKNFRRGGSRRETAQPASRNLD